MLKKLELLVGSGFGTGLLPVAPGTWGSLAAAVLGLISIIWIGEWTISLLLVLSIAAGFWSAPFYIKSFGDDPKSFVMDEWAGQFLSMHIIFLLPFQTEIYSLSLVILSSFIIFRFFDILKPLGIKKSKAFPVPRV
jgi:phosphatidylglycerophosphatase A